MIATTGTGIVLTSRIVYGMASYRVLPGFLSNVSRRLATPVAASVIVGLLVIAVIWVYLLATGITNVLANVVVVAGLLAAMFYATATKERQYVLRSRQPQLEPSPGPGPANGWATVSLISGEGGQPGSVAHSRIWSIPGHLAGKFAEAMTERFGAPAAEALSTVGAMTAAAESDAADGFLFIDGEAESDD